MKNGQETIDETQAEEIEDARIKEFLTTLIEHPFVESNDDYPITMVLVYSEGRSYLGGISGFHMRDANPFSMYAPLIVQEGMVQDPQTRAVHQQIALLPVSFMTPLMDRVTVRPSMVYQLRAESKEDQNAVAHYEKKYTTLQEEQALARAGIVSPTDRDIANLKNAIVG